MVGRFVSNGELDKALIVYGTVAETEAQREAALALQRKLASRFANFTVPIKADTEINDSMLKDVHILLVGRPATNRLTARLAKALPISFGTASFTMAGETFAHPHTAVVAAGPSPLAADRSVVVFAGLSAEGTWTCPRRFPDRGGANAEVLLMEVRRTASTACHSRFGRFPWCRGRDRSVHLEPLRDRSSRT